MAPHQLGEEGEVEGAPHQQLEEVEEAPHQQLEEVEGAPHQPLEEEAPQPESEEGAVAPHLASEEEVPLERNWGEGWRALSPVSVREGPEGVLLCPPTEKWGVSWLPLSRGGEEEGEEGVAAWYVPARLAEVRITTAKFLVRTGLLLLPDQQRRFGNK